MTSLTTALPLTRGLDNRLCFLLVDYLLNHNVWTPQIFHSAQYAYLKDDLASIQRPSIFAYPINSDKKSFGFSQNGRICLELHFSLQKQRVDLAQNVIQIANLIQLINLNQKFTQYFQSQPVSTEPPLMPGLFWFGKECKTDYTKVYDKESVVKLEFDYSVDLLAYQRELQRYGRDITSPDEVIYQAAQEIVIQLALLNKDLETVIIAE